MMIRPWMCRGVPALFLVVAFTVIAQPQQSVNDGIEAHRRGDYTTALQIFGAWAKLGNASAQQLFGFMYQKGQGVAQDYGKAVKWYRRAAEQGYSPGEFRLGHMYYEGWGVTQDKGEAVKWYRRAAEHGLARAQFGLGIMYQNGFGVTQDYVQAHKWYNLAATGHPPGWDRDSAVKRRERVEGEMTPDQVAEAQRLAREWKPKSQ